VFVLGTPDAAALQRIHTEQAKEQVTYAEVGATAGPLPGGYRHDHHAVELGVGDDVWRRAVHGIVEWQPHRRAGLVLQPERPPIAEGETVVLAVGLGGFSAVAACRIVAVTDEEDRFGFAYGTLPVHPERGEESFLVERDEHGVVRYVVTAFSRPRHPLARAGSPVARLVQRRVTRRYLAGLATFVSAS
jgi:uncharacterized protein (UPF0548 family)